MTIEAAIKLFMDAKRADGLSKNTLNAYHFAFQAFTLWLGGRATHLEHLSRPLLRDYAIHCNGDPALGPGGAHAACRG